VVNPHAPRFDVSRLLLDLDAENASNVRRYDPHVDGEPEGRFAKKGREDAAAEARIHDFNHIAEQNESRFDDMVHNRAFVWHINDTDILSTVLSGNPVPERLETAPYRMGMATETSKTLRNGSQDSFIKDLVTMNGIPQTALHDAIRLVEYMLHQQNEARARSTPQDVDSIPHISLCELFRRSKAVSELKRIIQFLLETPHGSQLISKLSGELGDKCRQMAYNIEEDSAPISASALELLTFCNDVVLNLMDRKLPIQSQLLRFGLELAVRCSAFPAARLYLAAGSGLGGKVLRAENCLVVLNIILKSLDGIATGSENPASQLSPARYRAAIFSLLTGYDVDGDYSPVSVQSMMHPVQPLDFLAFAAYIQILGELGALRTLWHIYQQLPEILHAKHNHIDPTKGMVDLEKVGYEQFASAFLRVAQNVMDGQISLESLKVAQNTGDFENDCRLDLETVSRSFKAVSQRSSSRSLGVDAAMIGTVLEEKILGAFAIADIEQSMTALERLLEKTIAVASSPGTRH
jgi:hypothetical protein